MILLTLNWYSHYSHSVLICCNFLICPLSLSLVIDCCIYPALSLLSSVLSSVRVLLVLVFISRSIISPSSLSLLQSPITVSHSSPLLSLVIIFISCNFFLHIPRRPSLYSALSYVHCTSLILVIPCPYLLRRPRHPWSRSDLQSLSLVLIAIVVIVIACIVDRCLSPSFPRIHVNDPCLVPCLQVIDFLLLVVLVDIPCPSSHVLLFTSF